MTRDVLTILTSDNRLSATSNQNTGNQHGKPADWEANLALADSNSLNPSLFQNNPKETQEYLDAVDGLRGVMEILDATQSRSDKLVRAHRLMEMSMARLQNEFHRILSANVEPTILSEDGNSRQSSSDDGLTDEDESSSSGSRRSCNSNADEICEIDLMSVEAVLQLRSIANRMVDNGYGSECVRMYGLTRRPVIEGCLNRIGVERLSTSDVQKMEWGILDIKIRKWIRAMRIAVRILFASEKRLCDEIFVGFNNVSNFCFEGVVKGPTTKFLEFGESVAMSMYETLWDLIPDIDTVYGHDSWASMRAQASTILVRLGNSARGILREFKNAIEAENSKIPVPGGTIHPLTGDLKNEEVGPN